MHKEVHRRVQDECYDQRQGQDLDDADELVQQEPAGRDEAEGEREPHRLKAAPGHRRRPVFSGPSGCSRPAG